MLARKLQRELTGLRNRTGSKLQRELTSLRNRTGLNSSGSGSHSGSGSGSGFASASASASGSGSGSGSGVELAEDVDVTGAAWKEGMGELELEVGCSCLAADDPAWSGYRAHGHFEVELLQRRVAAGPAGADVYRTQCTGATGWGAGPLTSTERWVPAGRLRRLGVQFGKELAANGRIGWSGQRVAVWWAPEARWYCGSVRSVRKPTRKESAKDPHAVARVRVAYDDGETHWGVVSHDQEVEEGEQSSNVLGDHAMRLLGSSRYSSVLTEETVAEVTAPAFEDVSPSADHDLAGSEDDNEDDGHSAWRAYSSSSGRDSPNGTDEGQPAKQPRLSPQVEHRNDAACERYVVDAGWWFDELRVCFHTNAEDFIP